MKPSLQPAARLLVQAARAVDAVAHEGRSVDDAWAQTGRALPDAAVRAVTLGTLRWYLRIAPALARLLAAPHTPPPLHALLCVGLHQLEYSRNRPETSVAAAVDAARALGFARAAGLVNAVLRRFLRERDTLWPLVDADVAQASAHPRWLVEALEAAWPEQCAAILAAGNAHPPLTLRVDISRVSRDDYLARLRAQQLAAEPVPWLPAAVRLARPVAVGTLAGFDAGEASVQDAGAQWAAQLLQVQGGERVLDACAAPGGKSGALLETAAIELEAIDLGAVRLRLLESTFTRLGRAATVRAADLSMPGWQQGAAFDRILVDAPCSGVGVVRRHPDIKLLRRCDDVAALATLQRSILRQCFAALKPGGRLVYCTCSMLPQENAQVVAALLADEPAAREIPLPLPPPPGLQRCEPGWQLLPGGEADTDGFYYACLTRC